MVDRPPPRLAIRRSVVLDESTDILLSLLADQRRCSRSDIIRALILEESTRRGVSERAETSRLIR